ncbi:DUF6263 family protein [Ascidiimonas sp. W6]|uniref:DUF6263 family protein n=1 Tax=Ascidiimonas meishanensis TaxID=3128903 RepID=UPI0030ED19A8
MKPFRAALFVLACLSCLMVTGQVTLRYTLQSGNTFKIKQESNQTVVQKIDDVDNIVSNSIQAIMKFEVVKELANAYELQITFTDIKMQITSNITGEILDMDVTKTENNSQNRIFKSLLNYPITAILETNGDISEIKGCENLINEMIHQSNISDAFTRDLMRTSLENDFGPNAMSQSYKQMTYFYPNKKVLINDSWHTKNKGSLETDNTWKLIELSDKKAILAANGIVNMNVNKSGMIMQLIGKQKSRLIANMYTGFLQELTIEGVAKGNSEIEMEEGVMAIPTVVTSTIKYNIIN